MIDNRTTKEIARDDALANNDGSATRYREMDPSIGRWTKQDPLQYVDGSNLYQNRVSRPMSVVDPSGLRSVPPGHHGNYTGTGVGDPNAIDRAHKRRMREWESKQREKVRKSLRNLCKDEDTRCLKLAEALADVIVDEVAQKRRDNDQNFGGNAGNVFSWLGSGAFQCIQWVSLLASPIGNTLNTDRGAGLTATHVQGTKGSGYFTYEHNWIEIHGPNGMVYIDPWPSGGGEIIDDSSALDFPGRPGGGANL